MPQPLSDLPTTAAQYRALAFVLWFLPATSPQEPAALSTALPEQLPVVVLPVLRRLRAQPALVQLELELVQLARFVPEEQEACRLRDNTALLVSVCPRGHQAHCLLDR